MEEHTGGKRGINELNLSLIPNNVFPHSLPISKKRLLWLVDDRRRLEHARRRRDVRIPLGGLGNSKHPESVSGSPFKKLGLVEEKGIHYVGIM